ncbi:hypothetical protein OIU77_025918 [Salix suchowensis]|uniref:Uncharacterized protein n=1 Tax=Salix suchowensis TaxID=1278906 RepID=A0ABQ9BXX5_9ROSI|nr:hypothetical protein OIU77_025918 [Salix suchowensis]
MNPSIPQNLDEFSASATTIKFDRPIPPPSWTHTRRPVRRPINQPTRPRFQKPSILGCRIQNLRVQNNLPVRRRSQVWVRDNRVKQM